MLIIIFSAIFLILGTFTINIYKKDPKSNQHRLFALYFALICVGYTITAISSLFYISPEGNSDVTMISIGIYSIFFFESMGMLFLLLVALIIRYGESILSKIYYKILIIVVSMLMFLTAF